MLTMLAVTLLLAAKNPGALQAERLVKEGDQLLSSERFEQALVVYREAIKADPMMMLAHYGAGQAQMALKRYPDAITSFKDARVAFERRAAENQDQRFENERAREERIQALRDRIRQNQERPVAPGSPEERQRDLVIQDSENQIQQLQRTEGGIGGTPMMPPGLTLALGSAYFRSGKMEDAEREYRAAIALQPRLGEPRNNLAVVLFLTGRAAEAQEQVLAAEKNGFKVASGLKKDIETALATLPAKP